MKLHMKQPRYVISDGEYQQRWEKTQHIMAQEHCDLILVYGDDHSFSVRPMFDISVTTHLILNQLSLFCP